MSSGRRSRAEKPFPITRQPEGEEEEKEVEAMEEEALEESDTGAAAASQEQPVFIERLERQGLEYDRVSYRGEEYYLRVFHNMDDYNEYVTEKMNDPNRALEPDPVLELEDTEAAPAAEDEEDGEPEDVDDSLRAEEPTESVKEESETEDEEEEDTVFMSVGPVPVKQEKKEDSASHSIESVAERLFDPVRSFENTFHESFAEDCDSTAFTEAREIQSSVADEAKRSGAVPDHRIDLPAAIAFLALYASNGQYSEQVVKKRRVIFLKEMIRSVMFLARSFVIGNHAGQFEQYYSAVRSAQFKGFIHTRAHPRSAGRESFQPVEYDSAELGSLVARFYDIVPIYAMVLSDPLLQDSDARKEIFPLGLEDFQYRFVFVLQSVSLFIYNMLGLYYESVYAKYGESTPQNPEAVKHLYKISTRAEQIRGWIKELQAFTLTLSRKDSEESRADPVKRLETLVNKFFFAIARSERFQSTGLLPELEKGFHRKRVEEAMRDLEDSSRKLSDRSDVFSDSIDLESTQRKAYTGIREAVGERFQGIAEKDLFDKAMSTTRVLYPFMFQFNHPDAYLAAIFGHFLHSRTGGVKNKRDADMYWFEAFYCFSSTRLRAFAPGKTEGVADVLCAPCRIQKPLKDYVVLPPVRQGIQLRFRQRTENAFEDVIPSTRWMSVLTQQEKTDLLQSTAWREANQTTRLTGSKRGTPASRETECEDCEDDRKCDACLKKAKKMHFGERKRTEREQTEKAPAIEEEGEEEDDETEEEEEEEEEKVKIKTEPVEASPEIASKREAPRAHPVKTVCEQQKKAVVHELDFGSPEDASYLNFALFR